MDTLNMIIGGITQEEIKACRDRISIGETITVRHGETAKQGTVIGKYEHYCLVQYESIREAVLWVDLINK